MQLPWQTNISLSKADISIIGLVSIKYLTGCQFKKCKKTRLYETSDINLQKSQGGESLWDIFVTAIAAYGVTGKLETILFYPAMALNMVLTTIIGQCVGGGRYDRARDYLKCALGYDCGLLVILSVLVVGFSKQLSGLFVKSSDVVVIVGTYFLIVSVGYVLNIVTNCYLGMRNGMGKPSKSMFLMVFYYIVVRMPLAYLLSCLGFGLNGIWAAVLFSHLVACVTASVTGTLVVKKKCRQNKTGACGF